MFYFVALFGAVAVLDITALLLAPRLARRLGNGLAFLITWFATSAISLGAAVVATVGLAAVMMIEGHDRLARSALLSAADIAIVAPPLWLLVRHNTLFVKGAGWRLTLGQRGVVGALAVTAIVLLAYDLSTRGELPIGANTLIPWLLLVSAAAVGLYVLGHRFGIVPAAKAPPSPASTQPRRDI